MLIYINMLIIYFFRIDFQCRIKSYYFSKKCFEIKYFFVQSLNFDNEKGLSFEFYRKYSRLHSHF